MAIGGVTGPARRWLRRSFGVWPLMEWRNRLAMGLALPRLVAFENSEVKRLSKILGKTPEATVACVIPTFRRPEKLQLAVESVLAQRYRDFVVVIVDDGGGLPSLPDDPRIHVVSLSRNSAVLGLVRNVGIRLTKSKYIAFLDDDNVWTPEHLDEAVGGLEEGFDLVYTAIRRRTADGAEYDIISRDFDRRTLADEMNYVDANSIAVRRTPGTLFSRLPRVRDTQPKEDWEFVYRQTHNARVKHIPVPTVEYLINYGSYYTKWII
jgi:glycosyltransferase involved in cell wall biosynthesis